ncbi:hypothetical protein Q5P01_003760 [Channa striata]|uniref:Apoptosis facilitator Bcl-2-like protein 14 n=1 Tax=Channa striata TaxID=64152 RepID=A0AA88T304_CHASR|nr:hypothetical protein Q5P01_003760 [Channa striata]
MEDTVEYRILMAYATRRRPKKHSDEAALPNGKTDANGTAPLQTPTTPEKKKKKKKKGWKRVANICKCVQPQTEDKEPEQKPAEPSNVQSRCGDFKDVEEQDEMAEVANRLTRIADEIPFTPPEIETDAPEDEVEKLIGLILRESGDRLNDEEQKNVAMLKELFWNYSFFKRLMTSFLTRMGLRSLDPESPGPHASPKTQIAVTCEATSRLSALDTMPMNQLLGFGARYVNEYFSDWAQQQGGYEAAFDEDDEVQ